MSTTQEPWGSQEWDRVIYRAAEEMHEGVNPLRLAVLLAEAKRPDCCHAELRPALEYCVRYGKFPEYSSDGKSVWWASDRSGIAVRHSVLTASLYHILTTRLVPGECPTTYRIRYYAPAYALVALGRGLRERKERS